MYLSTQIRKQILSCTVYTLSCVAYIRHQYFFTQYMGPYAGVDYNLALCALQSRLQHMLHVSWATLYQSRP